MEKVAHSESPKVVAWQDISGLVLLTEVIHAVFHSDYTNLYSYH